MPAKESPLPPVLRQMFAAGKVYTPEGSQVDLHSNVSEREATCLYEAVRELRPTFSLEVGFAQGTSALAILGAIADNGVGTHHVMDPFQAGFNDCGLAMVKRGGFDQRMVFHRKFAEDVIPQLPEVGFGFIDASHLFDLTLAEFVLTDKKLVVGGIVAFHDMWMPSQQALIRYILSNRSYKVFWPQKAPPSDPGMKPSALKRAIRAACKLVPRAERIFSREFLNPWYEFKLPNLVFLQKTAADQRDWRFHAAF